MRNSAAVRVGIAIILAGIALYPGIKHWAETRNFEPLDVPITLQTGEIIEQKFTVNIGGEYWADFRTSPHTWGDEIAHDWATLHFRFEIRDKSGTEVPIYSPQAQPDGTLKGSASCLANLRRGEYSAKLVILNGSGLLSKNEPRLCIATDDRSFPEFVLVLSSWVASFMIAAGLMLLLRRAFVARQERLAEEKAFSNPPTGSYPSGTVASRVQRKPRFATRSQWEFYSYYALPLALGLLLMVIVMVVLTGLRLPTRGVWVRSLLPTKSALVTKKVPVSKLVLHVGCIRHEPAYIVPAYILNGRLVATSDLQDELKHGLALQPNWTVYVDGDPLCPFSYVVEALDIVHGLEAKPVLVTPASRDLIDADAQRNLTAQRPVIPAALRPASDKPRR